MNVFYKTFLAFLPPLHKLSQTPTYTVSEEHIEGKSEEKLRLAIAFSGGIDSLALTYLTYRFCVARKLNVAIAVLIVDHNLQKGSAARARRAKDIFKPLEEEAQDLIQTHILKDTSHATPTTALQEKARQLRYRLLFSFCARHRYHGLLLGHNQNDQTITVLQRLKRSSGLDGLCGMRPLSRRSISFGGQNSSLLLLRPLLAIPKNYLKSTLQKARLLESVVEDPSNANTNFERNLMTHTFQAQENLFKVIFSFDSFYKSTQELWRARDALDFFATNFIERYVKDIARPSQALLLQTPLAQFLSLPFDTQRRVLIKNITTLRLNAHIDTQPQNIRHSALVRLIEELTFNEMREKYKHPFRRTIARCVVTCRLRKVFQDDAFSKEFFLEMTLE